MPLRNREMNTKLIELLQAIFSLSKEETLLETKLFWDASYPTTLEIMKLAQNSEAFDFLSDEPDLYELMNGQSI